MTQIVVQILLILVLILINGVLSMSETAVVSARKARLQQRAEDGDDKAKAALKLANEPSDFLSTVQIGITLVGILSGAFGGATVAEYLEIWMEAIPWLAPYAAPLSLFLVVLVVTYLSLVFGELVPKQLALFNPEDVSSSVAAPMGKLARITAPLVRLLSASTQSVLRIMGKASSNEPPVTEEEIKVMIGQGTSAGVFEQAEQHMVEGIFRLSDRRVGTLMTPRTEVYWLDLEDSPETIRQTIFHSPYSNLPVARGNLDHVEGIVQAKDLLAQSLVSEHLDVSGAIKLAQFVPESLPALQVLERFRESGIHIALVIDEFGGLQGLVTMMDVVEAIVGELRSADGKEDSEIVRRADGSWLLSGMLPIDEFQAALGLKDLADFDRGGYETLGGFVMAHMGRIPVAGDEFVINEIHYEVMDMDGMRVDKILVTPPAGEAQDTSFSI
ncbi:MAG TPA: hemolysin family protein [Anaerolineales bacterium]|nr:hemolysin family protein [Anaerolineales bacterium]